MCARVVITISLVATRQIQVSREIGFLNINWPTEVGMWAVQRSGTEIITNVNVSVTINVSGSLGNTDIGTAIENRYDFKGSALLPVPVTGPLDTGVYWILSPQRSYLLAPITSISPSSVPL